MLETYRYLLSWFETFRALESDRDELTKFTPKKKKSAGEKKPKEAFSWLKDYGEANSEYTSPQPQS